MRWHFTLMAILVALGAWEWSPSRPGEVGRTAFLGRTDERRSAAAAQADPRVAEFAEAVAELRSVPPEDPSARAALEKALKLLDGIATTALGAGSGNASEAANQALARFVTREPPVGESYRVYRVGEEPDVYALGVNFGSGGPSAVRLYARSNPRGPYQLAGQIDRFVQKDYFDDYLELAVVDRKSAVFVTVTGRTDELQSGSFALWKYDGKAVSALWSSDLLPHSSYEAVPRGLMVTYCADLDEENPKVCRKTVRDTYQWDGNAWTRVSQQEFSPRP